MTLHAAAGVVAKLLSQLTRKQHKPSNMAPAYKAACSSGCRPLLALLLAVAAADPQQQLPVLLQAAAEVGNLQVWTQLLLQNGSSTSSSQQQPDNGEQEQQEESAVAALPRLDWSCLSLQQITSALHVALPSWLSERDATGDRSGTCYVGTTQQQQRRAEEEVVRLQMADVLWQVLVVQHGREAALRQFLRAPVSAGYRGTQHPGILTAADPGANGLPVHVGTELNNRLLFCYSSRDKDFDWW
jgi:hypothetical protein